MCDLGEMLPDRLTVLLGQKGHEIRISAGVGNESSQSPA
jgi:hypothetical protein